MNIKNELLKEQSKQQMTKVAEYVGDDVKKFEKLISYLKSNDEVLQSRASWAISTSFDLGCNLVPNYSDYYMEVLNKVDVVPVTRNLLRILQWIKTPKSIHGGLVDFCFSVVLNPSQTIASKAFALGVLYEMCLLYPALSKELLLVCETVGQNGSSGLKNRAAKISKKLKK